MYFKRRSLKWKRECSVVILVTVHFAFMLCCVVMPLYQCLCECFSPSVILVAVCVWTAIATWNYFCDSTQYVSSMVVHCRCLTVTHVLVWWNCHSCISLVELSLMYWFGGTVTHVLVWWNCHSCIGLVELSLMYWFGGTVTHVLVWWNCHSCIGLVELSLMYWFGGTVTHILVWWNCHSCIGLVELSLMYWFGGTVTHVLVWWNCHLCIGLV